MHALPGKAGFELAMPANSYEFFFFQFCKFDSTPTGPRTVLRHAPELLRELDAQTQIVRARILSDRVWVLWWSGNGVPSGSGASGSDAD